jgi:hypothetical protein
MINIYVSLVPSTYIYSSILYMLEKNTASK